MAKLDKFYIAAFSVNENRSVTLDVTPNKDLDIALGEGNTTPLTLQRSEVTFDEMFEIARMAFETGKPLGFDKGKKPGANPKVLKVLSR